MNRWVLWTVMLMLGTALTTSCGDDGGDDGPAAGTGGSVKAGNGGDPMKIECTGAGEIVCGRSCCGSDDPMTPACCSDDVDGLCGMSVSAFGSPTPACVPMVETFAGCPSLTIPVVNFKIPSCCTADKMCGLEGTLFGMPGCTELGEAAMRAMQAFMRGMMTMTPTPTDEDGGVAGAGGMSGGSAGAGGRRGGFLPMFPPPQACPSN